MVSELPFLPDAITQTNTECSSQHPRIPTDDHAGADWLGPIKPICTATGALYVLLVVDYVSRFVWAYAFKDHMALEVVYMLRDVIAPIFGWPKGFYSDNGSHFVNHDVEALLQEHGVSQFTRPISHPASTGLLERAIQEMLGMISKKCIDRGTTNSWGYSSETMCWL